MRILFILAFAAVSLLLAFSYRDPFTVRGLVRDEQGKPIPGASVMVKGTTKHTVTDSAGTFSLQVPREGVTLQVSAVGYHTMEIRVQKDQPIELSMRLDSTSLQEVVVIGYGAQRKKDMVGVLAEVKADNAPQPVIYPLQGRAAGVDIQGQQGSPGSGTTIRIRGISSLKASHIYGSRAPEPDVMIQFEREGYEPITENGFLRSAENPLSTFSIDVDAASYSNVRRMIGQGQLPPAGAVRVEEMINYFRYAYAQPVGEDPLVLHTEIADCPWNPAHKLAMIGMQGKQVPVDNLPPSNLVFLVDVSGSMQDPQKLPLVKASMKMLTDQLRPQDRVAMVVYAGAAGLVLPSTPGTQKAAIKRAIDDLEAGGSTAGGEGIKLAYKIAREHFAEGGNNRVILCTDGDFNVGASSDDAMVRLIEKERESGVFLTVLGYGMGNYQDAKMQKLANKGNGNHAYIDNLSEARKVLVSEFGGTLFTIAKDVKLQVEFNPALVQGYRLIGYENRMLAKEDFNNDKKDAGELGSGHTVTAFYEIIPVGVRTNLLDSVDALKYQPVKPTHSSPESHAEMMTIKIRYKTPQDSVSKLLVQPVRDSRKSWSAASDDFRFAASVAGFGMLLRESPYRGTIDYAGIRRMAASALGKDPEGYRRDFLALVDDTIVLADVAKDR